MVTFSVVGGFSLELIAFFTYFCRRGLADFRLDVTLVLGTVNRLQDVPQNSALRTTRFLFYQGIYEVGSLIFQ